jgi:hypothetical protein
VRSIWIVPALSGALTGLARKNNATQAKAWAKFPWPFGPKPLSNPTGSWAEFARPFGPKPPSNPTDSWAELWYTFGVLCSVLTGILRIDTNFSVEVIGNGYEQKDSQSFSLAGLGVIFLNQVKSFRHLLQLFSEHRASVV